MEWKVPLADLDYGVEEENAVLDVLRRRWLTMGSVTQQFEEEFARFTGSEYALAVTNATVALHLACLAVGLGPGDEVIVPALTFVASANAVLYTGARVRFADILGPHDLNISPEAIERSLTPATRAILVVHYGGYPCQMEAILEIAARHSLAVIEDAAHAPGAALRGKALGTWGDVGCFSFFSNKNLSTGEGGMLVTNRPEVAEKARRLRSHGMTTLTWDRHRGHAHTYDVTDLGYNYRIDEIRAALGLTQLHKLPANNARRKALTETYWQALAGTGLDLPFREALSASGASHPAVGDLKPAYHIFPILLPPGVDREVFIQRTKTAGIQTSIHYPPVHQFSYYRQEIEAGRLPPAALPLTEQAAERQVTLPLYPTMSEAALQLVIAAVCQALQP